MKTSPHALAQGDLVDGRYRILRMLGQGGMGAVYEAEQARLHRRVALKLLRPELVEHSLAGRRFEREAQAAAAIRHRNVVEIFDFGEALSGGFYYAMELLDGRDLAQALACDGRMAWATARGIFLQIAAGLVAAHEAGTVHRDVKPANCFLLAAPWPDEPHPLKMLDFGIAKTDAGLHDGSMLTRADDLIGSAHYMAPEQAEGRAVDARTDVYGLGVTMYEVLTGRVPFEGSNTFQVLFRHTTEMPALPRTRCPAIPCALEAIVMRALAKDPARRWPTMRELAAELAAIPADALAEPEDASASFADPARTSAMPGMALEGGGRRAIAPTIALSRMRPHSPSLHEPTATAVQAFGTAAPVPIGDAPATEENAAVDRLAQERGAIDPRQTVGFTTAPSRRRLALVGLALAGLAAITGGAAVASLLVVEDGKELAERTVHAAVIVTPDEDSIAPPAAAPEPDLGPLTPLPAIERDEPSETAPVPSTFSIGPLDEAPAIVPARAQVDREGKTTSAWSGDAGAMSGVVRDERGDAVSAARVCAWVTDDSAPSSLRRRPSCARTDRQGAYRLADLVPSSYQVVASAREHLPSRFVTSEPLLVAAGMQTRGVDFQLRIGGVPVRGKVREGSGRGVARAFVWIAGSGLVQADERGAFSVWVEPGRVQATAWSPEHASRSATTTVPGGELGIELERQAIIVGKVLGPVGEPIAGARVRAGGSVGNQGMAYSDAAGAFRIDGLAPGSYRPIAETAHARGIAAAAIDLTVGKTAKGIVVALVPDEAAPAAPSAASPPETKPVPKRELDEDVKHRLARAIRRECGGEGISVVVEFAVVVGGEVSSPSVRSATRDGTVANVVQQCVARVAKKATFPRGKFRVHTLRVAL